MITMLRALMDKVDSIKRECNNNGNNISNYAYILVAIIYIHNTLLN